MGQMDPAVMISYGSVGPSRAVAVPLGRGPVVDTTLRGGEAMEGGRVPPAPMLRDGVPAAAEGLRDPRRGGRKASVGPIVALRGMEGDMSPRMALGITTCALLSRSCASVVTLVKSLRGGEKSVPDPMPLGASDRSGEVFEAGCSSYMLTRSGWVRSDGGSSAAIDLAVSSNAITFPSGTPPPPFRLLTTNEAMHKMMAKADKMTTAMMMMRVDP